MGGAVEVDETYISRLKGVKKARARGGHKNTVLSLLDRDTGKVRSFHVATATVNEVAPIVRANISKEAHLMTDQTREAPRRLRRLLKNIKQYGHS